MNLKLYNRLKRELLSEFYQRAEGHDRDYQKQVEDFASSQHNGLPKPAGRKIQGWLAAYNRLLATKPFQLRYYQILALYFTEYVLSQKRAGKGYVEQKALVYWMVTGSGKTLLMHLNILQFIDHIGGVQAFDELQLILTTPGVNLIEQHERELGEVVRQLNRLCNNRIKLIVATTGALLNREPGFFNMPESKRLFRLVLMDEGHITVSQARGAGELPFAGRFPDKPLLAFMGNTVEDPKKEGTNKDEVSDIRKFVAWLVHLSARERARYQAIFNGQYNGKLTLTRSPGIQDEIWLSWGDGHYWGLINVGNGDKFFSDCDEHPQLHNASGEPLTTLTKAGIVNPRYHFSAIDDAASPINVLVGSRKFAEGWNCFRVSIIGLINLGSTKGNKIIQIFGRGVRLKGLRIDGKRQNLEHCTDYRELVADNSPANQLRRLETLNVYSLNRSWLETFLKALEQDLPAIAGPFTIDVKPSVVKVGKKQLAFEDYRPKLHTFKVGQSDFDAPLRMTLDSSSHDWHWQHVENGQELSGTLPQVEISLDYRSNRMNPGHNLIQPLKNCLTDQSAFLPTDFLQQRLLTWGRQQRVQVYQRKDGKIQRLALQDLLPTVGHVLYDHSLGDRSWTVVERLLDEVQRDVLEKIFHKVRYDIDKRRYRYETVRQSIADAPGDFIDHYSVTFEFARESEKQAFEKDVGLRGQLEFQLKEESGDYHIYEPLLGEATETLLRQHKLQRTGAVKEDVAFLSSFNFVRCLSPHRFLWIQRNDLWPSPIAAVA